uniref:Methyltransferase domain-containing protein n=1 Tax=Candidatus Kentrum sp. TUN TaxID=2126343 RepID=A0A450ZVH7_9GAMM|nr:MAG: Methyltransferase domain-containing protein [Candidatus Kentron sp. TUN]VFK57822.1 MAG: Methyltransferase domain-containing protein [Candidatus Kentron sp. TUN]VFK59896.1 MAG: Methyltransferase domain-containing protein [Candidatus Kentron sp. TUN]
MSDIKKHYHRVEAWENFWSTLTGEPAEVVWNVSHDKAVAVDFERFRNLIALNKLPLVDVGCGDGTQTIFFAEHVESVIGVDGSSSAIEIARSRTTKSNLDYAVLNIMDKESCQSFYERIGDANIYMRGVLAQILPQDRPAVLGNLRLLMGMKGYLFLSDLLPENEAYFASLIEKEGMPSGFARVLQHGIAPEGIGQEDIDILFSPEKFKIMEQGRHVINTVIPLAAGGFAQVPALYLIVKAL